MEAFFVNHGIANSIKASDYMRPVKYTNLDSFDFESVSIIMTQISARLIGLRRKPNTTAT